MEGTNFQNSIFGSESANYSQQPGNSRINRKNAMSTLSSDPKTSISYAERVQNARDLKIMQENQDIEFQKSDRVRIQDGKSKLSLLNFNQVDKEISPLNTKETKQEKNQNIEIKSEFLIQDFVENTTSRNIKFINQIKKPQSLEIEINSNSHDKITTQENSINIFSRLQQRKQFKDKNININILTPMVSSNQNTLFSVAPYYDSIIDSKKFQIPKSFQKSIVQKNRIHDTSQILFKVQSGEKVSSNSIISDKSKEIDQNNNVKQIAFENQKTLSDSLISRNNQFEFDEQTIQPKIDLKGKLKFNLRYELEKLKNLNQFDKLGIQKQGKEKSRIDKVVQDLKYLVPDIVNIKTAQDYPENTNKQQEIHISNNDQLQQKKGMSKKLKINHRIQDKDYELQNTQNLLKSLDLKKRLISLQQKSVNTSQNFNFEFVSNQIHKVENRNKPKKLLYSNLNNYDHIYKSWNYQKRDLKSPQNQTDIQNIQIQISPEKQNFVNKNEKDLSYEEKQEKNKQEELIFQEFVKKYEGLRLVKNPLENRNKYMLGGVQESIELSDMLVQYRNFKNEINKANVSDQMEQKLQFYKNKEKLLQIDKVFKNQEQSGLYNSIDFAQNQRVKQNMIKQRIQKPQNLCIVEKLALNYLFNLYNSDDRYYVNQKIKNRLEYLDVNASDIHIDENLLIQKEQILCERHGDIMFDEKQYKDKMYSNFRDFYNDLLQDKHCKVDKEKICQVFLEQVMDPKNYLFKRLRNQILNIDQSDQNNSFQLLRDLNPQIFIKQEKQEENFDKKLIQSSVREKIKVEIPQKIKVCCYIPNKEILVNEQIFENLVKGMIEEEVQQKKDQARKLFKQYSKNDLIDLNIKTRQLTQQQKQKASLSPLSANNNQKVNEIKESIFEKLQQIIYQKTFKLGNPENPFLQNIANALKKNNQQQDQVLEGKPEKKDDELNTDIQKDQMDPLNIFQLLDQQQASNQQIEYENNLKENQIQVFKQKYQKQKISASLKQFNKQPTKELDNQTKFLISLKNKFRLQIPHFLKIKNHSLYMINESISHEVINLLSEYIYSQTLALDLRTSLKLQKIDLNENDEYRELKELQIDEIIIHDLVVKDCQMKDKEFSVLFKSIANQGKLQSLHYSSNEFGQESINAFRFAFDKKNFCLSDLKSLSFKNLKISLKHQSELFEIIEKSDQCQLESFRISELNLNEDSIIDSVCNILKNQPSLFKFELCNCLITMKQIEKITNFMANFWNKITIQNITMSYLEIRTNESQIIQNICQNICKIIKDSKQLIHLDLSGLNLQDNFNSIFESINKNNSLLSIHLHDIQISNQQKDKLFYILSIDTQKFHYINEINNLQEQDLMENSIISKQFQKYQKIKQFSHKFFKKTDFNFKNIELKKKAYEIKILNHQLKQEKKEETDHLNIDKSHFELTIRDPMILTRKFGHPELIFNESIYNKQEFNDINQLGKWSFQNSSNGDGCYVCQKHSYIQLFFNRQRAQNDFQRIENIQLVELLKSTFQIDRIDSYKQGSPILISSFNSWVITRLIDVNLFTQLLKGENEDYILRQVQKKSQQIQNQLESQRKKLEESIQKPQQTVIFNFQAEQKILKKKEELLKLEQEINQFNKGKQFVKMEMDFIDRKNQFLKKQVSSTGLNIFQGIQKQTQQKQNIKSIIKRETFETEEDDKEDFEEMFKNKEWYNDLQSCSKYKNNQININYPNHNTDIEDDIFVFAGYVKPGMHIIFIFDPFSQEFFKKEFIVEVRKHDLEISSKKEQDSQLDDNSKKDNVFKDWSKDDELRLQNIFYNDFQREEFSAQNLNVDSNLFFRIQTFIAQNYLVFIESFKVYLSNDHEFIKSDIKKFTNFLILINIINPKQQNQRTIIQNDFQKKSIKINTDQLIDVIFHNQKNLKQQIENITITRFFFIFSIIKIALKNYQLNGNQINSQFIDYFQTFYIPDLIQYIKRNTFQSKSFRQDFLMQRPVLQQLSSNLSVINTVFERFSKNQKIKFTDILKMLKNQNIYFKTLNNLQHQEQVIRMVILSKQTVCIEDRLYMYTFLEKIEFYELIVRIAHQYYHYQCSKNLNLIFLKENFNENQQLIEQNQDPKSQILNKELKERQAFLLDQIQQRSMIYEPLEYKVFWLLKNKLAPNSEMIYDQNEYAFSQFLWRRKMIENLDVYNFVQHEKDLISLYQQQESKSSEKEFTNEKHHFESVKEENENVNGDNSVDLKLLYSQLSSINNSNRETEKSVSNSSDDFENYQ